MRFSSLALSVSLSLVGPALVVGTTLHAPSAFAGGPSKAEQKQFEKDVQAAYPGAVWALKDLPVNTGYTMGVTWVGPLCEVTKEGYKIDTTTSMSATYGSAKSVWYSVRPNETLALKESEFDDGVFAITFIGTGSSKGRDTKIKITGVTTFAEVKGVMDQLLSTTSPVEANADWAADIKDAISKRHLINGMTKKQAYLVVGEPTGSSSREEGGKKIEIWNARQNNGMKIGYGASVEATGYPAEMRFEDGKLVGVATGSGGGVNLE